MVTSLYYYLIIYFSCDLEYELITFPLIVQVQGGRPPIEDRFSEMVRGARSSSGNDELSNSKHGSIAKAYVDDREARSLSGNDELSNSKHGSVAKASVNDRLQGGDRFDSMVRAARSSTGNDELSNSKHGSVAKAQVNDRLQGGDRFDSMVRAARSSTGNDELSNSKHGSVAKAQVNDRLQGGDKFDAMIRAARSSSGTDDEPVDRFDAMVRGVKPGRDELGSSKHGNVTKAMVGDRDVAMKKAKSMNATTGGGTGRFDSMRRFRSDDLGRSLNGRSTFGDDDLGGSRHGGKDKALPSPNDRSPRDLFGRNATSIATATSPLSPLSPTAKSTTSTPTSPFDRFDSMVRKAKGQNDDHNFDRQPTSLLPPSPPIEGDAGSSNRPSAMDVLKEIVSNSYTVTFTL